MKVLFLTRGMPPPFLGGSGIYYYNIFRRFPPGEVTIFTEKARTEPSPEDLGGMSFIRRAYIRPNIPNHMIFPRLQRIRGMSTLNNLFMLIPWSLELVSRCFKDKPDVVFIGQLFPVGLLGLLALRLFNIPYIVFVHGEELSTMKHIGDYRWNTSSHILQKAFRIVANSTFTRQQVIDTGIDPTRIEKITPMVDTEIFHPNHDIAHLKEKLSIGEEKVLLTIGRLIPRKGHSQVISILRRLISEFGKIKYIIVGEDLGEGTKLRKLAADLNVEKSVIFAGRVSTDDLPKYYCICDVMVLPNYERTNRDNEGFGMVFLEANACGKPVIGGRAGGTGDAVVHGETGLLVDVNDEDALYEAVAALLKNGSYARRLSQNGRRRVLTSFHWDRATKAVRELSLQALHTHSKSKSC